MRKVYVVGDANVDIIVPYPRFLDAERTKVEYPIPELQGGGTAANTAVALARLGVPVCFLGSIGEDQYGKYIISDFQKEGVDSTYLIVEKELNTVAVFAFIDENGERYLWGWPRVDQAFKILKKEKVPYEKIKTAGWVHSSGMPLVYDTSARREIIEIFKSAYELGIPTSFDLNLRVDNGLLEPGYEKAVREIIRYTKYLLGSGKDEFRYLGDSNDWRINARKLVSKDRTVIVRNGDQGSCAFMENEELTVPAFPVKVIDTVGAGDVYNAGFISGCLEGKSMKECLLLGNAVSGYTVSKKGARNCPFPTELKEFLSAYKEK